MALDQPCDVTQCPDVAPAKGHRRFFFLRLRAMVFMLLAKLARFLVTFDLLLLPFAMHALVTPLKPWRLHQAVKAPFVPRFFIEALARFRNFFFRLLATEPTSLASS